MSRDQANVTMDVDGDDQECRAQVATAYADVEAELTAMTTDYRAHGPSGYQIQRMRHTMLRDSRSGTFAVPRGVVPRLMRCLQRLGWTVEVRDPIRWSSRFAVDESVIENAKSASLKLALWSVVSQARAQVEYANRSEMTEMLRGMVCMYPSAGILIPVATRSAAWHIWMNLRSLGNIQLARGNWRRKKRIVVCPFPAISAVDDPGAWQVVLVPDARLLADAQPHRAIERLLTSQSLKRVIALRRPDLRLSHRQQLLIERLAGRVVFHANPQNHPVTVVLHPGIGAERVLDAKEAPLTRKRRHTWHHARRNRLLARIGDGMAMTDERILGELGIRGAARLDLPELPRVMLLVESTEHGSQLFRLLPGWALHKHDGPIRPSQSRVDSCIGRIVTLTRALREGIEADVIVRCGGGWPMVEWPVRHSEKEEMRDHLLIDIDDNHDPEAQQDALLRIRDYEGWGWHFVQTPANRSPGIRTRRGRPAEIQISDRAARPGGCPSVPGTDHEETSHGGDQS